MGWQMWAVGLIVWQTVEVALATVTVKNEVRSDVQRWVGTSGRHAERSVKMVHGSQGLGWLREGWNEARLYKVRLKDRGKGSNPNDSVRLAASGWSCTLHTQATWYLVRWVIGQVLDLGCPRHFEWKQNARVPDHRVLRDAGGLVEVGGGLGLGEVRYLRKR